MAHLNFNWDASPTPDVVYNLYEDGVKVVPDIGKLDFSLLMDGKEEKEYSYYVTAENKTSGLESAPSNTVTFPFFSPAPPTGLAVSLSQ